MCVVNKYYKVDLEINLGTFISTNVPSTVPELSKLEDKPSVVFTIKTSVVPGKL